jgi:Icc-related predicted phosphoesterase
METNEVKIGLTNYLHMRDEIKRLEEILDDIKKDALVMGTDDKYLTNVCFYSGVDATLKLNNIIKSQREKILDLESKLDKKIMWKLW